MAAENGTMQYRCATQDACVATLGVAPVHHLKDKASKDGMESLVLGMGRIVPRWDVVTDGGLQLLYFVRDDTFPNASDAKLAANHFEEAAKQWNQLQTGLEIIATRDKASANFYVRYYPIPPDEGVLAEAFFPHEPGQDVIIYPDSFTPLGREGLTAILTHELGHVFGLRHEFAIRGDPHLGELGEPEVHTGAVQFMQTNDRSVMNYHWPPTMQQSDRDGTKAFYQLPNGTLIGNQPITDYRPQLRTTIRKRDRDGRLLRVPQVVEI